MNSRKANWAFLISVIGTIALSFVIAFCFPSLIDKMDNLFWSNLLSELVVILPVMIFLLASGEKPISFLEFHRIKPGSVLMIVLFTFLSYPFLVVLNLFSQFWVENEVTLMVESMNLEQLPFGILYLSLGIVAPVFEEMTCRGAFYRSYRKAGSAFKAMMLSAIIFAFFHMNFNQAAYALAMGILAVLLVEATGSLWSSVLYHGLINGSQAVLIYFTLKADPGVYSDMAPLTNDYLILALAVYLILAAITLPLAWAVLVWLSEHEGRRGVLSAIWRGRKEKKDKMVTVPFVLALILCISVMTGAFVWLAARILMVTGVSFY